MPFGYNSKQNASDLLAIGLLFGYNYLLNACRSRLQKAAWFSLVSPSFNKTDLAKTRDRSLPKTTSRENEIMMVKLVSFASALCAFVSQAAMATEAPWKEHGALQIAPGSHTIEHDDGTPFLWIGDTAWGMAQQLTHKEVDEYLDNRRKLGFTVIQVVAYWYPHGGGNSSGPHNASNAYGYRPFAGGEDTPDTNTPLTVNGGNAKAPNDYWDNLDYIVSAVKKRHMYLALLPCWGRAYITAQFDGSHQVFSESQAKAYGVFLGNRYRTEPNIIWMLGGDAKAQIKGYDKHHVYMDYDKRPIFRAMAEGIGEGVTGKKLFWNQPDPAWKKIFMTYHPDGDVTDNSSKWFQQDAWLTANGVEIWKEVDQVYPVMLSEYQLSNPVKPSLFLEGSYEYGSYGHECGWVTPLKVRRQVYDTFFAGGAGHTYGAGPIWAMRGNGGDYSCGYTWKQALAFPAGAQFSGVAKAFLQKYNWSQWVPDTTIMDGAAGAGESLKIAVSDRSDMRALVYFSNVSTAHLKNTLGDVASARWFDPRSGQEILAGQFAKDEVKDMTPPEKWEDAILILQAASSGLKK